MARRLAVACTAPRLLQSPRNRGRAYPVGAINITISEYQFRVDQGMCWSIDVTLRPPPRKVGQGAQQVMGQVVKIWRIRRERTLNGA